MLADATRRVSRGKTPLIGREDETALLESLFERVVREGRPHLVTVIGPAGVGKSRLMREVVGALAARPEPAAVRVGHCPAYGARIGYWALAEVIRDQFEIVDTDDPQAAWEKLRDGIEQLVSGAETDEPAERLAAMVARPLGIEPADEFTVGAGFDGEDPQETRDRLFSAVRSVAEAMSRRRPLVLAFEDIHWADEGMLDLIEYLARWVRGPVLLICLARDELLDRRPGWGGGRRNATTISLEPLTDDQAEELVSTLISGTAGDGNGLAEVAPRWPSARAATRCSPRRWSTASARRNGGRGHAPRHRALGASGPTRLARVHRAPPSAARRCRRPDLLGGLAGRALR